MIPLIPWYITLIVLAISLAIPVAVWRILSAAVDRSGIPFPAQRKIRIGAAVMLGAWLGAALVLAPAPGSLENRSVFYLTPMIPLFALVPPAIVLLAVWLSPNLRQVLAGISLPAIIGVQVYRVIGAVFLVLLAQGQVPANFALPAGWGDVIIGTSAPLVALALTRGSRTATALAITWNVVGLLDLAVAIGTGTGVLTPLFAPEFGGQAPTASAMGVFPMILVPTVAVPISALLHILALRMVLRRRETIVRDAFHPREAEP